MSSHNHYGLIRLLTNTLSWSFFHQSLTVECHCINVCHIHAPVVVTLTWNQSTWSPSLPHRSIQSLLQTSESPRSISIIASEMLKNIGFVSWIVLIWFRLHDPRSNQPQPLINSLIFRVWISTWDPIQESLSHMILMCLCLLNDNTIAASRLSDVLAFATTISYSVSPASYRHPAQTRVPQALIVPQRPSLVWCLAHKSDLIIHKPQRFHLDRCTPTVIDLFIATNLNLFPSSSPWHLRWSPSTWHLIHLEHSNTDPSL